MGNKIVREPQIPERTAYYWINEYQNCNKEKMCNKPVGKKKLIDPEEFWEEIDRRIIQTSPN